MAYQRNPMLGNVIRCLISYLIMNGFALGTIKGVQYNEAYRNR